MKIANVPFPLVSCCTAKYFAAQANATHGTNIPEYTVCYRMLIDSYNEGLFTPFSAFDGKKWNILDRQCWKCGRGSEGYQGGLIVIGRNIPGGGLASRELPNYHQYNLARDIAISKWTHICYAYSTVTQNFHMYQDGLKVYSFTYGDEEENSLTSKAFNMIRIGANMRGLMTDIQVYNEFYNIDDMVTWTTSCPGTKGEIFDWDITQLNTNHDETSTLNVTFIKMDMSEVCPSKAARPQKPRLSSAGNARKRFKPPKRNRTSNAGSVLELITDPDGKVNGDAQDRCFRLNGKLITLPQNKEDEDLMNGVLLDYMRKKSSNNESEMVNVGSLWNFVAANTRLLNREEVENKFQSHGLSSDSRQQTYPLKSKTELFHSWTGEPLHDYRGDLILPQVMTYYKYPQLCVYCLANRKKIIEGHFWNERLDSICTLGMCTTLFRHPYICEFSTEPTFTVRGLSKYELASLGFSSSLASKGSKPNIGSASSHTT